MVIANNTDRYGRWMGTLMIGDIDINAEQVKAGMAWAYRYHGRASDETMLRLEKKPSDIESGCGRHLIQWIRESGEGV